jgi:cyclohexa-1,5-dienecarbonyl-CoA hydratase
MSNVRTERDGPVLHAVLDRPPLNVLTIAMMDEVRDALLAPGDARVVVIRGEGKAFSAGVDVREHLPETIGAMLAAFRGMATAVLQCAAPVVAQVHGACLGGGMELAMAADLAYASEAATFGQPEIKLGVYPPFAVAAYPRWFGRARAAELVLLGETMSAREAYVRGFVTGVVPADELAAKVRDVCGKLAALSPSSLRATRKALRLGEGLGLDALEAIEHAYREDLMATEDAMEGLRSFLEKRPPTWKGR